MNDDDDTDRRKLEPPSTRWYDHADEAIREALKKATGGAGKLILDMIVPSRLSRRRAEFERDVAEAINQLDREHRVDREKLADHDQFISNHTQAALFAIQTHDADKRRALRNAVLNTALDIVPDETRQQIYMRWINELTTLHLHVLKWCNTSRKYPAKLAEAIEADFPETRVVHLAQVIVTDLVSRNLIYADPPAGSVYRAVAEPRITTLGSNFLSFIGDPFDQPGQPDQKGL